MGLTHDWKQGDYAYLWLHDMDVPKGLLGCLAKVQLLRKQCKGVWHVETIAHGKRGKYSHMSFLIQENMLYRDTAELFEKLHNEYSIYLKEQERIMFSHADAADDVDLLVDALEDMELVKMRKDWEVVKLTNGLNKVVGVGVKIS